ncbi:hypothetical protein, conserved [Eimeria tenella]|uniref:non-specific serine/threonine protein kinase n=1 Tax=Eimeria tenella TaxID=5802 RepID=U6L1M6_EIMTE|nr:hypothetical protein, conserved [Eimeria tenella]CDJ42479.1 hypothetical protein, conserved [Eimeria tenella]|eukprot:XP_013233229.1 hypothetical protein, conserved [Eimeria tenella]
MPLHFETLLKGGKALWGDDAVVAVEQPGESRPATATGETPVHAAGSSATRPSNRYKHRRAASWAILSTVLALTVFGAARPLVTRRATSRQKMRDKVSLVHHLLRASEEDQHKGQRQASLFPSRIDPGHFASFEQGGELSEFSSPQEDSGGSEVSEVSSPEEEKKNFQPPAWTSVDHVEKIPSVDEPEGNTSVKTLRAQKTVAGVAEALIKSSAQRPLEAILTPAQVRMAEAVAETLSGGATRNLIGLKIHLSNLLPLGQPVVPGEFKSPLKITRIVGSGVSSLLVEAQDLAAGRYVTLRVHVCAAKESQLLSVEAANLWVDQAIETRGFVLACAGTPAVLAANLRGLLVADHVGNLGNLPPTESKSTTMVFQRVDLYGRLLTDLRGVVFALQAPLWEIAQAKEYIARRLLLQTLHLHEAGVSHNSLTWSNFFLNEDGEFYLAGMDAAVRIGERLHSRAQLEVRYTEPQLLSHYKKSVTEGVAAFPHEKSDMWSLGVLLYELFTGEAFSKRLRNELVNGEVSSSELASRLEQTSASPRWQQLTLELLQPERDDRISAEEIFNYYGDLFQKY